MRKILIGIAVAAAVAACKDDKGGGAPAASQPSTGDTAGASPSEAASSSEPAGAVAPSASGGCDISVEGSITMKDHAPANAASAGTDYWMSEDNLRSALGALEKDEAKIEKQMKDDPRFVTLILNCTGTHAHVSFSPSNGSKYADIPFGPKKYKLQGEGPGSFHILGGIDGKSFRTEKGTLDVTRFDDTGIAATFEFDAGFIGSDDRVKVSGTIDFPCPQGYGKCKQ